MSQITKTYCDLCGEEIEKHLYFPKYGVTQNIYAAGNGQVVQYVSKVKTFDICDACAVIIDSALTPIFEGGQNNET